MNGMVIPSFADAVRARRVLAPHLPPTPTWSYPALDAVAGTRVHVKHENTQPTGAFKVRGGLYLLSTLPAGTPLVTYSTGNHAQSIAYAARAYGAPCRVVMPAGANPAKVRAVAALGAEVTLDGADMAGAQRIAERLASGTGAYLVSPGDEPALVAGVATLYLELFEAVPDLEAVYVPVGSGTGAAAAGLVASVLAPGCRVIGVQSSAAPSAHDSWRSGTPVHRPSRTTVEGLATGRPYRLPQAILKAHLSAFTLVEDAAIADARRLLASHAHTLAEGAGAAGLAAVLAENEQKASVAVVCTGGNASPAELADLVSSER